MLTVANVADSPWKLKVTYSYAIVVVVTLIIHVIVEFNVKFNTCKEFKDLISDNQYKEIKNDLEGSRQKENEKLSK